MRYLKLLWNLYRLKKNTRMKRNKMQALQQQQLCRLLRFAYQSSPFYREAFQSAGITEEQLDILPLSAFPTISKTLFLEQFDQLVTAADLKQEELRKYDQQTEPDRRPYKGKYHLVHSSGSTGKPGYFIYDEAAWSKMLLGIIRAALWDMSMPQILKFLARGPRIVYVAATDGRYGGAMAVGDGIDGVGARQIHLDINMPIAEWITKLKAFEPNMIIGYPSAVKILGELAEQGLIDLKIERIVTCGEPLGASLRSYLETMFRTKVINFYGSSESLAMGVEISPEEGMLLFDDFNVIEMAEDGIYLTSLYNYAQPLIRYRISDHLTLQEPDEGSRCPFTRAIGLLGRNEDLLWFEDKNGNQEFLHPLAIEGFCLEGLKDYQFYQSARDAFEMIAEISETASEDVIRDQMMKQMRVILEEKQLGYVTFYVRFTDQILSDPKTGKKRLIVKTVREEACVI